MCSVSPCGRSRGTPDADGILLRHYYAEREYLTSPEGIMKVVSVIVCVVLSVVWLNGSCAGGPLRATGAALELGCAAALACLCAARLLHLAHYAPFGCLLADLVGSAVIGVVLLVTAALGLVLCDQLRLSDYIHGPLGILNAGIVTASAVVTYSSVTRRWDAARTTAAAARRSPRPPPEQDV